MIVLLSMPRKIIVLLALVKWLFVIVCASNVNVSVTYWKNPQSMLEKYSSVPVIQIVFVFKMAFL